VIKVTDDEEDDAIDAIIYTLNKISGGGKQESKI